MIFSYCTGVSSPALPCTQERFLSVVRDPQVAELIQAYRKGDKEAKRKLPAFCFQATFAHSHRLAKNAVPTGLYMVDFDHLTEGELLKLANNAVPQAENCETSEVMLVHVTPSGKGLRVVCKAIRKGYENCDSIADFQHAFAKKIDGLDKLDEVTTDLARLSFAPQFEDILYCSDRLWTEGAEITRFGKSVRVPAATAAEGAADDLQEDYKGVRLSTIFEAYFAHTGGLPAEGVRNSRFYAAARDLRYICDFNPQVIARHMPDVGLPFGEVLSVCQSACQSTRSSEIPEPVRKVVDSLVDLDDDEDFEEEPLDDKVENKVNLPSVIRIVASLYPASYEESIVLAMLPVLGTLATRVRGIYLDGEVHSPSFMTMVTAEQASGKSFARKIVRFFLKGIKEEDDANREIEKAYQEQLKMTKNSKRQPTRPNVKIRIVPPSVSVAKLLQRLDNADHEHLFSFAEELDTVIKSNGSGAWSQKSDMYRNAFDNAEYGQDYMSDASYSAVLPVYYNLLFCGTPRQTHKFFKDVENGLVSRCCFTTLPDQFGAKMPKQNKLTDHEKEKLNKCIIKLREADGVVNTTPINKHLAKWLERERLRAITDNDRARDTFRRRAAVIGFRAAMTLIPLYRDSPGNYKRLAEFAEYIADLVLRNQLTYAGAELNRILDDDNAVTTHRNSSIFEVLPDTFSKEEVTVQLHKRGKRTPARNVIYVWMREHLIEKDYTEKTYKKLKK